MSKFVAVSLNFVNQCCEYNSQHFSGSVCNYHTPTNEYAKCLSQIHWFFVILKSVLYYKLLSRKFRDKNIFMIIVKFMKIMKIFDHRNLELCIRYVARPEKTGLTIYVKRFEWDKFHRLLS